jgi:RNA polymerase sigma-70 factor (ECF subfamily)
MKGIGRAAAALAFVIVWILFLQIGYGDLSSSLAIAGSARRPWWGGPRGDSRIEHSLAPQTHTQQTSAASTGATRRPMGPDLIDRAKRGDKEAFTTLVLELGDRLYSVAYRILRDAGRAEDAVQQTFLIAWRELPSLRDERRLEAWLYRLLVNACYAEIRHTRRWQAGLRLVPLEVPSEDDAQLSVANRDEIERAFRRLSGEQRAVLVLHHYVGLSGAEIGTALGLAPGTVRSRLHYARQLMRAAIEAAARAIASGGTA